MNRIETALLVDNSGGRNIFEMYAQEIEQAYLDSGDLNKDLAFILEKIQAVERQLQDLSEHINATNENEETVYSVTISNSRNLLNVWHGLFRDRDIYPNVVSYLSTELDKLINYTTYENVSQKIVPEIKDDFDTQFILEPNILDAFTDAVDYNEVAKENDISKLLELNSLILKNVYDKLTENVKKLSLDIVLLKSDLDAKIEDGEDTLYTWDVSLWIDTTDAVEANKFMYIISSALGYIEDVKIDITDTKVGSFLQKWIVKFKGWISKDDAKQILKKGAELTHKGATALESYALDRHIEPIEKSRADRKKVEEDLKRLVTEDQAKELNELLVKEKREDLKAKKLANFKSQLELRRALSEMLANGLLEIDSDYKIMINNLLLISQENKKIELGNIEEINDESKKEHIENPDAN
jgi:TusA-related sulfurtransferase